MEYLFKLQINLSFCNKLEIDNIPSSILNSVDEAYLQNIFHIMEAHILAIINWWKMYIIQ